MHKFKVPMIPFLDWYIPTYPQVKPIAVGYPPNAETDRTGIRTIAIHKSENSREWRLRLYDLVIYKSPLVEMLDEGSKLQEDVEPVRIVNLGSVKEIGDINDAILKTISIALDEANISEKQNWEVKIPFLAILSTEITARTQQEAEAQVSVMFEKDFDVALASCVALKPSHILDDISATALKATSKNRRQPQYRIEYREIR